MKKALLFVAAATLFFSCSKEIEPVSEDTASTGFTFKASIENLATKADMDGSYGLVWAKNDKIGIGVTGWGVCQPFTLQGKGGSDEGDFEWDYYPGSEGDPEKIKADAYAAFFPWQDQGGDYNSAWDGVVYFKMQGSYGNTNDLDNTPYTSGKMLTPLVGAVSNESIAFKHVGAAVKVTINNLPAGAHSIGMTADQQLYGNYKINVSDAGTSAMVLDGDPNASLNTIWLNYEAADAERPFTFIFPTPALTTPKLSFIIYDKNGVVVWSKHLKAQAESPNRGQVLVMPALDITPYSDFDQISAWGVSGSHNSWGDTPMVTAVDGNVHIANDVTFEANAEFKIRKNGDWAQGEYNWSNIDGTDGLENAGGNIRVLNAGTYDIILNTSTHKIKVVASELDYPNAAGMPHHTSIKKAKNLGETETANCYVITKAGNYKIPAVKGNSNESAGTVTGVELLWETYNNGTSVTPNSVIAAVDYEEGEDFVYFKTPATLQPGNAVIAAKNGDEIIWSWHIWIPETAIEDIGEYAISSKYYMDRNLGALKIAKASTSADVDAEALGLYYEWGRKDPFRGGRAINSSSLAKYAGTEFSYTSESVDMAYSIAHPTTYAKNDNWNDGITDRWGQGAGKTIYDPCPAGYRIPEYNSSEVLWGDVTTNTTFLANGAHGWWMVGSSFVFPMAGEGGFDYADHVFDRSKVWTAKQLDDTHPQHGLGQYIYYSNTDPKDTWSSAEAGEWQSKPSWGIRKRYLASVRCQKIAGEVPAPDLVGATSVVMDGAFTDWTGADAITTDSGRLPEWKFGWDASNLYLYFKITKNRIDYNADSKDYDWESYIYIGIDTDNNTSTGARVGGGTDMETGGEVKILIYPWRGNYDAGTLSIVSGEDSQSEIQHPVKTVLKDVHASIEGSFDDTYCYLEVSIPRSALGDLSSKIAVAPCMNYSSSHRIVIPVYD